MRSGGSVSSFQRDVYIWCLLFGFACAGSGTAFRGFAGYEKLCNGFRYFCSLGIMGVFKNLVDKIE